MLESRLFTQFREALCLLIPERYVAKLTLESFAFAHFSELSICSFHKANYSLLIKVIYLLIIGSHSFTQFRNRYYFTLCTYKKHVFSFF